MDAKILGGLFLLGQCNPVAQSPGAVPSDSDSPVIALEYCATPPDSGTVLVTGQTSTVPDSEQLLVWVEWTGCLDDQITACWDENVDLSGQFGYVDIYLGHEPAGMDCGETLSTEFEIDVWPIRPEGLGRGTHQVYVDVWPIDTEWNVGSSFYELY